MQYQELFLFSPRNPEFKKLINGILNNDNDRSGLKAHLIGFAKDETDDSGRHVTVLDERGYEESYNLLVGRTDDGVNLNSDDLLNRLPDDAYHGTIETYFSSLLNPRNRSQSFWRLVNYYWNAFFSIAVPLIKRAYGEDRFASSSELYRYALSNLNEIVGAISGDDLLDSGELAQTYYGRLRGCFDHVVTTNYTSFAKTLQPSRDCTYLSCNLWSFESVETLCSRDIRTEPIKDDEFVFPFLMTQVPIKPIVDARQIKNYDYARAMRALDETGLLVVLGYSFCENDSHIVSMVHDYLLQPGKKMIYLDHGGKESSQNLGGKLRLDSDQTGGIDITRADERSIAELVGVIQGEP